MPVLNCKHHFNELKKEKRLYFEILQLWKKIGTQCSNLDYTPILTYIGSGDQYYG